MENEMKVELERKGKVRDIYSHGDNQLLIVTTDRISAYDVILESLIPERGKILTTISQHWFSLMIPLIANHIITTTNFPSSITNVLAPEEIEGRSMLVHKTIPLKVECIVRGYLAGSGYKDYKKNGKVCGIQLPQGLLESSQLPEPLYTPSTKADKGHDENISFQDTIDILGDEALAFQLKNISLAIYKLAANYARDRGIILADTKFEYGLFNNTLMLIDELLTPDSSRYWDVRVYQPGRSQDSFDKQIIRDYLAKTEWYKNGGGYPAPKLSDDVIKTTLNRYTIITNRLMRVI
jgi:phosphoribosylaminoimidazole-succinocarboxamide synthase